MFALWHAPQMEAIATSTANAQGPGSPCLSEMLLLNLDPAPAEGSTSKKLSKQEKQDTLEQLTTDGWLALAPGRHGHYCLGVRTERT